MTDYKALCAELLAVFDNYDDESNLVGIFDDMKANKIDLLDRARTALAAEQDNPTDEHILRLAREWNSGYESIEFEFISDFARAVLDRWGQP